MPLLRLIKKLFGIGSKPSPLPDGNLYSFVWLLKEPRLVNEETVLILARKVLGDDLITVAELPKTPDLPGSMFMVVAQPRQAFGVIFADRPYVNDVDEEAANIPELRRRTLFAEHTAWLAVDVMGERPTQETWAIVGKMVAEFAGPDCLLLYSPSHEKMEPYSDELVEALQGQDALSALGMGLEPPVVAIGPDSEKLQEAEEEARRRWPEFLSAFHEKDPSREDFAVKAPFETPNGEMEHMWVMVEQVEGDIIRGSLGNDPIHVRSLAAGSHVELEKDRISDWVYMEEGEMVGGFSMKVLLQEGSLGSGNG